MWCLQERSSANKKHCKHRKYRMGEGTNDRNASLALQKSCYLNNNADRCWILNRCFFYCGNIGSEATAAEEDDTWFISCCITTPSPTGPAVSAAWVSSCKFQKEIWAPGKIQAYFTTGKHMLTCNSNWAGILWEVLVLLFTFDILLFANITRTPKQI